MSLPTSATALVILGVVVIPGYIYSLLVRRSISFFPQAIDFRYLLTLISCSFAMHVVGFLWTIRILGFYEDHTIRENAWEVWGWVVVVLLALPAGAAALTSWGVKRWWVEKLLRPIGLSARERIPSAWDYAFNVVDGCWVRVFLTDGNVIGGLFAKRSFTKILTNRRDIFFERTAVLDDDHEFVELVADTLGCWVSGDSIQRIEFLGGVPIEDDKLPPQAEVRDHGIPTKRSGPAPWRKRLASWLLWESNTSPTDDDRGTKSHDFASIDPTPNGN